MQALGQRPGALRSCAGPDGLGGVRRRGQRPRCARFTAPPRPVITVPPHPRPTQQPAQQEQLQGLRPGAPLRSSGMLSVSPLHSLAFYEYGQRHGPAAVFLHGGPGAGCWPNHARFFDLDFWRVILVDQRGCGRSEPRGSLASNTTQALVDDLERLRQHLGIQSWLVVGGSWGVALALAYTSQHAAYVSGLVLRGVCLMRPLELQWMYGGLAGMVRPAAWAGFLSHLTPAERDVPLAAYYTRLTSSESAVRDAAARAWMAWEAALAASPPLPAPGTHQPVLQLWRGSGGGQGHETGHVQWEALLYPEPGTAAATRRPPGVARLTEGLAPAQLPASQPGAEEAAQSWLAHVASAAEARPGGLEGDPSMPHPTVQARLEAHYSLHGAFELAGAPLLSWERLAALRRVPCVAVQGAADMVCPPGTAWALHEAWPEMELRVVPGAGHSMYDPRITHELVGAIAAFQAELLDGT